MQVTTIVPLRDTIVPRIAKTGRRARKMEESGLTTDFIRSEMAREGEGYGGAKRLANATNCTERAGRNWRNGTKEPRATDFLLMARAFKPMRDRLKLFLEIPDRLLHRYHDILDAMEEQIAQGDGRAADVLARAQRETPSFRRSALRALSATTWSLQHPVKAAKVVKATKPKKAAPQLLQEAV